VYQWRKLTDGERKYALDLRRARHLPWHTPPHLDFEVAKQYLVSATCYEHACVIGKDSERMTACESDVLSICREFSTQLYAWCVLPNHYHVLVRTGRIKELRESLGQFHGRSSHMWNGEDDCRGRKVWYNCFERPMKSERHFLTTLNYVQHNPVHHGYVVRWQDWPWSSAREYLEKIGHEKAKEIWRRYPLLDYGKKWDI
jgi:putative transposase